jgi:hypothetical protein
VNGVACKVTVNDGFDQVMRPCLTGEPSNVIAQGKASGTKRYGMCSKPFFERDSGYTPVKAMPVEVLACPHFDAHIDLLKAILTSIADL